MVRGLPAVRRRLRSMPEVIRQSVRQQLEKEATKLVAEMSSIKPMPEITIDWTWGDVPPGSVSVGRVSRGRGVDRIAVTIYATATTEDYPGGFPAIARWAEFGTKPRFTQEGAFRGSIVAAPYFYPPYRANVARIRRNIANAVRRGVKKL